MTTTYNNRRSEQLLAAMPIVLGSGPGAGVQARTISISEHNLYNPFGLPVSRIQRRANRFCRQMFVLRQIRAKSDKREICSRHSW